MPYTPHNFQSGDILLASELNEMDEQIASLTDSSASAGNYTITEGSNGIEIIDNTSNN